MNKQQLVVKNFISVIIFLNAFIFSALAQIGPPRDLIREELEGFHVAIHSMLGHSSIAPQNAYGFAELDPEFFFAFSLGVRGGFQFTAQGGIFAEYNFSRLGGRWSGVEAETETSREIRIEYWQIPLLFKYNWLDRPRFYVMAGPEVNLLKSAVHLYNPEGNHITGRPGINGDITERFKDSVLGVVMGAGVELIFAERLYGIFGVRFSYILSDINNEKFKIPNLNNEYKASHLYFPSLNLGLGYIFPSNK